MTARVLVVGNPFCRLTLRVQSVCQSVAVLGGDMRRREIIAVMASAAPAWPFPLYAQQAAKLPTIGILAPWPASPPNQNVTVFAKRLRELGWIEGRTVAIEY